MHFLEIIGPGYELMPIRHPSFHGYLRFSSTRNRKICDNNDTGIP